MTALTPKTIAVPIRAQIPNIRRVTTGQTVGTAIVLRHLAEREKFVIEIRINFKQIRGNVKILHPVVVKTATATDLMKTVMTAFVKNRVIQIRVQIPNIRRAQILPKATFVNVRLLHAEIRFHINAKAPHRECHILKTLPIQDYARS